MSLDGFVFRDVQIMSKVTLLQLMRLAIETNITSG